MTTPTLDLVIAGAKPGRYLDKAITPTLVAGRPHSLWYLNGFPGPGTANVSQAGGIARSSTAAQVPGQIPFTDPAGGVNTYLTRFWGVCQNQSGSIYLCDRLWDCGANSAGGALSPTSTSAQTINSVTLPTRDINGSANGDGVFVGIEISTALGLGTPVATLSYTNSGGTSGRTANNSYAFVASSAIGAFYPIALQSGDAGVRSVQTITMSTTQNSGQWNLVAYRIIDIIELSGICIGNQHDLLQSGFPQLYNGTVPFLIFVPNTTTASYVDAMMNVTQI